MYKEREGELWRESSKSCGCRGESKILGDWQIQQHTFALCLIAYEA